MSRTTLAGLASRCPWGLVGMVALILIVESGIEARSLSLFDVDEWAFRWTGRAAVRKAKGHEILCFGDSLVKLSVIPRVVGERTGKRVYNLALSGSQAPSSYFLLKRALDSGGKPEAVVVDFNPPLLRVGPRHNINRWGALIDPVEAAQLAWWSRDPALFAEVTLGRILPSIRGRYAIRAEILGALASRGSINPINNPMGLRNWKQNDGAQLMVGSAGAKNLPEAKIRELREGYYPKWSVDPANSEGVDRFLRLASEHNIRVFWLLAPLVPALHDEIARAGIDARQDEFLRAWQAKYPNLVILDARKRVVDPEAFWDPQHLSVVGASAFSQAVGDVLRRSMGGKLDGNWLILPEVAKVGPVPPGIEDIDQSRLAVEAAKVRR
jgi:hypothetical protein